MTTDDKPEGRVSEAGTRPTAERPLRVPYPPFAELAEGAPHVAQQ
ncbi:MAG TPA: hypothetical protein VGP31_03905 [Planosporangium sp.]|nr:hypothetical protein [Planosporangium sp.]